MAVNHADGTMFVSVVFFPIAAAVAASRAGAGWFTILFVPAGLAVGIGVIYVGRKFVYAITGFALSRVENLPDTWIQQVAIAPFFLSYLILPYAIVWAGVFGTWVASIWLVKHLL
jgi:hypothetical protein